MYVSTPLLPFQTDRLIQSDIPPETLIETLSILSILIVRFPSYLADPNLEPAPLSVLTPLLSHSRVAVRKRAITTLAQFLPVAQSQQFGELLKSIIFPNLVPSAGVDKQRTTVQLVAAVARHSPHQIAPVLNDLVPSIIKAVSKEDEELRESGLQVSRDVQSEHALCLCCTGSRSARTAVSYRNYTVPRKRNAGRHAIYQI